MSEHLERWSSIWIQLWFKQQQEHEFTDTKLHKCIFKIGLLIRFPWWRAKSCVQVPLQTHCWSIRWAGLWCFGSCEGVFFPPPQVPLWAELTVLQYLAVFLASLSKARIRSLRGISEDELGRFATTARCNLYREMTLLYLQVARKVENHRMKLFWAELKW